MFHEDILKIFFIFPTVNISKVNFWLVICIAKDFKSDFLNILIFFAPSDSRFSYGCILSKYCPILTNHTSTESLFIQMMYKSQFQKIYPYDCFCGPWSHFCGDHDTFSKILWTENIYLKCKSFVTLYMSLLSLFIKVIHTCWKNVLISLQKVRMVVYMIIVNYT